MTAIEILKSLSDLAFETFTEALDGVTQAQSWAVLPQGGPDYLHTDGSIHGITLHVASCMAMYASAGFRNTEIRWRDCAERLESFEPNWDAAREYLHETHRYWMESWANLREEELETEIQHPQGKMVPAWRIIRLMIHHYEYHGGQIAMLRYACGESETPPPSYAEDIRKYCADSVSW
jgi:uncharacterized damage-inducible protein DinB